MGTLLSRLPTTEITPLNFNPTLAQVHETLAILTQRLPTELGIDIINAAAYWPRVSISDKSHRVIRASGGETVERIILLSPEIRGKAIGRARITVDSRDQGELLSNSAQRENNEIEFAQLGWSSFPELHSTRNGSTSWFAVGILRPIPDSTTPHENPEQPATPLESPSLASNTFTYLTQIHSRLSSSDSMVSIAESTASFSSDHSTTSKSQRKRLQNYFLVGEKHLLHHNVHAGRTFVEFSNLFQSSKYPSPPPQTSPPSPPLNTATLQSSDTNLTDYDEADDQVQPNWVDQVQENDILAIWALAKYVGWLNEIRSVSLELDMVVL